MTDLSDRARRATEATYHGGFGSRHEDDPRPGCVWCLLKELVEENDALRRLLGVCLPFAEDAADEEWWPSLDEARAALGAKENK